MHLNRQYRVFEWCFVTCVKVSMHAKMSVDCTLVHCWVSGALSPYCVPDWLMGVTVVVVFVAGSGCCVRTV